MEEQAETKGFSFTNSQHKPGTFGSKVSPETKGFYKNFILESKKTLPDEVSKIINSAANKKN